ncbi:tetratricopeptide repeat protein [Nemorincola caseinilytica]|uniref:Tetratricopeptide repeat protein n=1 Tax=Nemorincola caseinilytica TaxID=2054315 RepID=A0ABP8NMR4_9BACT
MAKKRQANPRNTTAPAADNNIKQPGRPSPQRPEPTTAEKKKSPFGLVHLLILAGISVITWLTYQSALANQFTNWDDLGYVLTDPLIKDSSIEGLKRLFLLESRVMGNYHPLTMVTYWWEYGKEGLEPAIYHLDSIIFHIITTATAYIFVRTLTRSILAAAIAALLFAVHPMRVESVTWIAGRKDILYGMFYLLACTTHILYIRAREGKRALWFVATILLFALSLLCKSVGVTLPVVLLLIDLYERRDLKAVLIIEKLPLFGLSMLFGLISIYAQKDVGALGTLDVHFTVLERLALGCYALCTYVWKMVVPVGLTNFYPYPIKVNDALPAVFYVYPLLVGGALFAIWKFGRHNRLLLLGVLFFIINLLLLLQFLPVGGAVMSDRYTYIPYVGLFLLIGYFIARLVEQKKPLGTLLLVVVLGASGAYAYMTSERNKDWYDSVSLWTDAIEKDPESPIGYFYLGQEYYTRFEGAQNQVDRKKYGDSALVYFSKSVERKPDYTSPIICIGEYMRSTGRIEEAKTAYLRALAIKDGLESAYLGLGVVYSIQGKYDSAAPVFRKALALKKFFPEGYSNYANFLEIVGKSDSAIITYEKAISQNPDAYIPYMNRGRIYMKQQKYDLAIKDYDHAVMLKPEYPDPLVQRAQAHLAKGNKAQAHADIAEAKKLGALIDPALEESSR